MDMIWKSKYIFTLLSLLILQSHSEMIQFANSISTIDSEGRRLINSQLQSAQVHGDLSTLMYYYIDIYVGDKRMKQSLIIDTGSALTAFPCKGNCSNWGTHFNTYYDPNTSKNYFKEKCDNKKWGNWNKDQNTWNFSQGYKEGSRYEGFYASDSIVFGESGNEEDSFHMIFGCVTKETNLFYTQRADGILGLSLHHNEKYFPSISQQYKKQKLVDSSQFMIWLGKDAGIMTIGGYKENLLYDNQTVIQWFPSISNSSYSIQLDKLFIGNVHIPHVPRIGFIDSGASFTYTSHEELEHIRQAFDQYCTEDTIRWIGKKVRDLWYEYDNAQNLMTLKCN